MFRRILIGNRGEVAARVIRTARRMGIETVAVCSDVDADLSYLRAADAVANIGGRRSYLDADAIIDAALDHRCTAVHPGWGFLSENPSFAARCEAARVTFVGPRSATMRRMADKAEARQTMLDNGLRPIPGSEGVVASVGAAEAAADQIGYPVLIKAVSGGGGRGLRIVRDRADLSDAFDSAAAEALGAFGDPRLYMERLVENAHHIELQVMGDGQTTAVLGERECSIQRRHQKLLEETPSPALMSADGAALRADVIDQVSRAVSGLRYRGAGTIEMLLTEAGELFFMEMNTRLQVEHTVTEAVTGVDLVEHQLRVAANQPLGTFPAPSGHAIQCRINAEDPADRFRPSPGRITGLTLPDGEGIRVDTHLAEGDVVSPHYDSMIAKVIAHGPDRMTAIQRMTVALAQLRISGVHTTVALHQALLAHPQFIRGDTTTAFLETELDRLLP
jgi:acetyl-CoA carboxylase biotin carboxylase subunit